MSDKNTVRVSKVLRDEASFIIAYTVFPILFIFASNVVLYNIIALLVKLKPSSYYFFFLTGILGNIYYIFVAVFFLKIRLNRGKNLISYADGQKKSFIDCSLSSLKIITLLSFVRFIIWFLFCLLFSNAIDFDTLAVNNFHNGEEFGVFAAIIYFLGLFSHAFGEEFMFRYVFYEIIKRKKPENARLLFLILSSLCFGLLHSADGVLSFPKITASFMMGFALSFIYLKTNNLLYPVFMHFLSNSFTTFSIISLLFDPSWFLSKFGEMLGFTILGALNIFVCFLVLLILTFILKLIQRKIQVVK